VSGRGNTLRPSPVKVAALEHELLLLQPHTLRDALVQTALAALVPDAIVVAAFGLILPREVLEVPRFGAVNVHASLLPRWRGAAPVQRAILAGDERSGVSIMRMETGLDTGPYCVQRETPIADKTASELTAELAEMGADALLEGLSAIEAGTVAWTAQDEAQATYAEKVTKADLAVGPDLSAAEVVVRVRASLRSSPSRAVVGGRALTLVTAAASGAAAKTASVHIAGAGVLLGASDGAVLVTRVKPEGKAEMSAADWARGVPGIDGATWERAR